MITSGFIFKNLTLSGFKANLKIIMVWETQRKKKKGGKEGNVLFNDALNTFYLQLYGIKHMVKDHSERERENPLPPLIGLLLSISSKGSFICTIPYRIAHTMAFFTPVMEHWLEQ